MKKYLCVFVFFLLAINLFSQQTRKVRFGLKLGNTISQIKYSNVNDSSYYPTKARAGLLIGCNVAIQLSKKMVFEPAILLVGKGANQTYQPNLYSLYLDEAYYYLEIPLNILYQTSAKNGTWSVGGGLSPAFKRSKNYLMNELKDFDLGLDILTGYKFPIGFSFNLGYTHGIKNASQYKAYSLRNKYFSLTIGYEF